MNKARVLGLLLACMWLLLGGCAKEPAECSQEVPCEFGEVCIGGQCESGRCSTSAQCPMEHTCKNRNCEKGCSTDNDCYPGSMCDMESGQCASAPCLDTQVDCGYREFCNTVTGECYDAGNLYCKPCDRDNEELDCGSDNICFAGHCGVDCSEGKECPGGFDCYPFNDESGNIVTWQCITYCWLYEDYKPGAFAKAPPGGLTLHLDPACEIELPSRLEP